MHLRVIMLPQVIKLHHENTEALKNLPFNDSINHEFPVTKSTDLSESTISVNQS